MSLHAFMADDTLERDLDLSDERPTFVRAARSPNPEVLLFVLKECTRLKNANFSGSTTSTLLTPTYLVPYTLYTNFSDWCLLAAFCLTLVPITTVYNSMTWMSTRCALFGAEIQRTIHIASPCVLCETKPWPQSQTSQTAHLNVKEIATRRKVFPRFWSEHELPTQRFRSLPARTAATVGDVQLFDQVRAAGPEENWWMINPQTT